MRVNPLTYGVGALRHALYPGPSAATSGVPDMWLCMLVTVLFAVTMFVLGTLITLRRTSRDAQ